ncbi:33157_t:CDS:2, partial [Gigaspora margarita]
EKRKELSFYADLHQAQIDKESMHTTVEPTILTSNNSVKNNFNNIHPGSSAIDSSQFLNNEDINSNSGDESSNEMDINSNSGDESSNEMDDSDDNSETDENLHQLTINELRWFCNDIENLIGEDDPALHKSVRKFIKAYKKRRLMQDTHVRPAITSFFQTCEWNAKRANNNGYQRGGTLSKGRRKMRQGKPRKNSQDISTQETKGPTILLSLHGQENTKQNVLMI